MRLHRFTPPFRSSARPGDTDGTVMVLSGLVLLLVLLLAVVSGVAFWQFRQVAGFKRQLAQQGFPNGQPINGGGMNINSLPEVDEELHRQSMYASSIVAASATHPLSAFPLLDRAPNYLPLDDPEAPPGGERPRLP